MKPASALLLALVLGAGIAAAGFFIGHGWVTAKQLERTETVKGLPEREVPADIAIWPIQFNVADNNVRFRYLAATTITVYSRSIDAVRQAREELLQLSKSGIAISSNNYDSQIQFLFEGLNALKKVRVVSTLEYCLAD